MEENDPNIVASGVVEISDLIEQSLERLAQFMSEFFETEVDTDKASEFVARYTEFTMEEGRKIEAGILDAIGLDMQDKDVKLELTKLARGGHEDCSDCPDYAVCTNPDKQILPAPDSLLH